MANNRRLGQYPQPYSQVSIDASANVQTLVGAAMKSTQTELSIPNLPMSFMLDRRLFYKRALAKRGDVGCIKA